MAVELLMILFLHIACEFEENHLAIAIVNPYSIMIRPDLSGRDRFFLPSVGIITFFLKINHHRIF